jgi:hypothetical protein
MPGIRVEACAANKSTELVQAPVGCSGFPPSWTLGVSPELGEANAPPKKRTCLEASKFNKKYRYRTI